MMMAALEAGGIAPAWDEDRERLLHETSDGSYLANERFYETEYRGESWPLQHAGKAVKVMPWWLKDMAAGDYVAVAMRRNREEIAASYEAAFHSRWLYDYSVDYEESMDMAVDYMKNRADISRVEVFDYASVVASPLSHMERLRDAGWPINAQAAASVIDQNKYRFRADRLAGDTTHAVVIV